MKSKIESLGIYLPEGVLTTADLMNKCKRRPRWDLEKLIGVKERRTGGNETSFDLAYKACWNALKMSRYEPADIDMIMVTSISRLHERIDELHLEPSLSTLLRSKLGMRNALTFDVVNACAGMMTGMYIMDSYIRSGAIKTGIVVSGERITILADTAAQEIRNSFDGQMASLTVGDCGAAVVMDASMDGRHGFQYIDLLTGAEFSKLCVAHPSKRGKGYSMVTKPVRLHKAAMANKDPYMKEALDLAGWTLDDCHWIIPHQTSERVIKKGKKSIEDYMNTELNGRLVANLQKYGNTSSTSHMLALHEKIINDDLDSHCNILFMVQASGLVLGHAAYVVDDLPARYRAQFEKEKEGVRKYA